MQSNENAQRFKLADAGSYDPVADSFDRFTDRYSGPFARRIVSLAALAPSHRVLDVGTGTGLLALAAARAVGPGGEVFGVDLSEGMLAKATVKADEAALSDRVQFRRMDAEELDFPDQSFDSVISLYALRHFPNPERALAEIRRVLRPSGRLVVGVGSGPPLVSFTGLMHRLGRLREVPRSLTGRRLSAPRFLNSLIEQRLPKTAVPEESSLARSHLNWSRVTPSLVRRAGFVRLRSRWEGYEALLDTPEEFWELQSTFSSIARKRIADAPAEQVRKLQDEFLQTCRQVQARGGQLAYPYAAFFVVAECPD